MKRLLTLVLAVLLLLSFAACDNTDPNTAGNQSSTGAIAPGQKITFEELTVVDNDLCTIKITGIEPDSLFGYTLNIYLENKSADKTFMFSASSAAINGVMTTPLFASSVAPGKKANESMTFYDSTLSDIIGPFTDIELTFRVYDSNDWSAEDVALTTVHVYPYGEEQAVSYQRAPAETDQVLVDNEYVTVIVTGYEPDSILGYAANLYLVNKTDTQVMFSTDGVSVNGYMADPYFATTVNAGKSAFSSITWSESTLSANGITQVDTIEFTLRAYNALNWQEADFVNAAFSLKP